MMTTVFVDTAFYVALLGSADQYHDKAVAWSRRTPVKYVTTEFILVEVGNFFTTGLDRKLFADLHRFLRNDPTTRIIPASSELFERGAELFAGRPDKLWSLTDCISFRIMTDLEIGEALTADRHFQQAGFVALLAD